MEGRPRRGRARGGLDREAYSSEVLGRIVDAAVQIHGGYGVSKEFPLERWYREARVRRIGEGPSEVHRMVIARSLFR